MATITAKFPGICAACSRPIAVGNTIEYVKGSPVRHTDCAAPPPPAPTADELEFRTEGQRVYVLGNTFPFKGTLKVAGAHWDGDRRAWWVGAVAVDDLRQALAQARPAAPEPYRPRQCQQCGVRPDRRGWPRISRSGICSDCYRDEREEAEMGY